MPKGRSRIVFLHGMCDKLKVLVTPLPPFLMALLSNYSCTHIYTQHTKSASYHARTMVLGVAPECISLWSRCVCMWQIASTMLYQNLVYTVHRAFDQCFMVSHASSHHCKGGGRRIFGIRWVIAHNTADATWFLACFMTLFRWRTFPFLFTCSIYSAHHCYGAYLPCTTLLCNL